MTTTPITKTAKGHRVWLQSVYSKTGRTMGQRYDVAYVGTAIHIVFSATGKRKVTEAKGGIIDLVGKKVTQWAQGATKATVHYSTAQIIVDCKQNHSFLYNQQET
jgi:hypothetical protein